MSRTMVEKCHSRDRNRNLNFNIKRNLGFDGNDVQVQSEL